MITIIGMVYKSTDYLHFMVDQVKKYTPDIDFLVVLNDATTKVLDLAREWSHDGQFEIADYRDDDSDDYYLNRVYRAWNYGANMANGDKICFINSDMAFSPGWLDALDKVLTSGTGIIPCSRLVESGKMPSGKHAISKNFGRRPADFKEAEWQRFAADERLNMCMNGGLYMPCMFYRNEFFKMGGYPEGNIYMGGVGKHTTPFVQSGDAYFFESTMTNKQHVTVFDSLVYHIQEGEMDER